MPDHLPLRADRFLCLLCYLLCAGSIGAALSGRAQADTRPVAAQMLISERHMQQVPQEGCWYVQSWRSPENITGKALPARYRGRAHPLGTAIEVVETAEDFSALHRLATDEIWHFYGGAPLEFLLLFPDGHATRSILDASHPVLTVPHGVWQGSRPLPGSGITWSHAGTTMAPGFIPEDFEIADRATLQQHYPAEASAIEAFLHTVPPETTTSARGTSGQPAWVLHESAIPKQTPTPGVTLTELAGLNAPLLSEHLSVARFTLAPGHGTPSSYNTEGDEILLIQAGRGTVTLGDQTIDVTAGDIVRFAAGMTHRVMAAPAGSLEFHAISSPPFSPTTYREADHARFSH